MSDYIETLTTELETSYMRYKDNPTAENRAALSDSMLKTNSLYAHEGLEEPFGRILMQLITLNNSNLTSEQNNRLAGNFFKLTYEIKDRIFQHPKILDTLFTLMLELKMDPQSKNYVLLYRSIHYFRKFWKGYIYFCRWWNLDNFKDKDYVIKKGAKMSIAESALISYTKCLINTDFKEDLAKLAVIFIQKLSQYPLTKYSNYYTAKLLHKLKYGNQLIRSILRPFIIAKPLKPWAWHLMSKTFDSNNEFTEKYSCMLLALKFGKTFPDNTINDIYLDMALMYYNRNEMPYAKFFMEIYTKIRQDLGYKVPDFVKKIISQRNYSEATPLRPNTAIDYTGNCREILRRTPNPDKPMFDELMHNLETNYSETIQWSQDWYDTVDEIEMNY
ncbi:MAG: hypothetical protein K6F33_00495 [Bacteroidales bacterium]|nr:hypothetical protein [Bacteroidales bacterium]